MKTDKTIETHRSRKVWGNYGHNQYQFEVDMNGDLKIKCNFDSLVLTETQFKKLCKLVEIAKQRRQV